MIRLNLQISLGKADIFLLLSLAFNEHGIFLHFFRSLSFLSIKVFLFLCRNLEYHLLYLLLCTWYSKNMLIYVTIIYIFNYLSVLTYFSFCSIYLYDNDKFYSGIWSITFTSYAFSYILNCSFLFFKNFIPKCFQCRSLSSKTPETLYLKYFITPSYSKF